MTCYTFMTHGKVVVFSLPMMLRNKPMKVPDTMSEDSTLIKRIHPLIDTMHIYIYIYFI